MPESSEDFSAPFKDPAAVAAYAERASRLVPGLADLQRMAALLVAERAPEQANVLVIGAGGGVELKVFAQRYPQWRFVGVDPSREMLDLAQATLGPLASRAQLHHGYVDTAPDGPFDAATCLLTMHFLTLADRRHTLAEIRRRLNTAFVSHGALAILQPTTPCTAPLIEEQATVHIAGQEVSYLALASHTVSASSVGLPGISLPAGQSRAGLPFGVELDAPLGSDRALLDLARRTEGVLGARSNAI